MIPEIGGNKAESAYVRSPALALFPCPIVRLLLTSQQGFNLGLLLAKHTHKHTHTKKIFFFQHPTYCRIVSTDLPYFTRSEPTASRLASLAHPLPLSTIQRATIFFCFLCGDFFFFPQLLYFFFVFSITLDFQHVI